MLDSVQYVDNQIQARAVAGIWLGYSPNNMMTVAQALERSAGQRVSSSFGVKSLKSCCRLANPKKSAHNVDMFKRESREYIVACYCKTCKRPALLITCRNLHFCWDETEQRFQRGIA
jgi:hypothetical protein